MSFYRPLPGAGGGSAGPAYDDTELSGRVDAVEQAVGTKASADSVSALGARVTTLEGGSGGSTAAFWQGGEILNVPADYATISAAIASAKTRYPLPGAKIEIVLASGSHAGDITVDAVDLSWIKLRGSIAAEYVSPSYSASGGAGNWTVTLSVSSAFSNAVSVGDVITCTPEDEDWAYYRAQLPGSWVVTGKSSTSVTVRNTSRSTLFSSSSRNLRLRKFGAKVQCDQFFMRVIGGKSPIVQDLMLVAIGAQNTGLSAAIIVERGGVFATSELPSDQSPIACAVGVNGFRTGILASGVGSIVRGTFCIGACILSGVVLSDAAQMVSRGIMAVGCGTGGGGDGVYAYGGAAAIISSGANDLISTLSGNNGSGIQTSAGATCVVGRGHHYRNVDADAYASDGGAIVLSRWNVSTGAFIGTVSPQIDTIGNVGALVSEG